MGKGPAETSGINLERIAIFAGTAFAKQPLPATPQVGDVPITGRASSVSAQGIPSSVIQATQLVATRNSEGLVLKMPEHYTVRIHRQDYSDTKALVVSVDNNRLEMIAKVKITIYSAQSFDTEALFPIGTRFGKIQKQSAVSFL